MISINSDKWYSEWLGISIVTIVLIFNSLSAMLCYILPCLMIILSIIKPALHQTVFRILEGSQAFMIPVQPITSVESHTQTVVQYLCYLLLDVNNLCGMLPLDIEMRIALLEWMSKGRWWHKASMVMWLPYVTVWAKTQHVRTQTEIHFIVPAYSYTKLCMFTASTG